MNASSIITKLQLLPHPEGGYYKETYRSKAEIVTNRGSRNVSTAIYFLLEEKDRSNFHRIQSDELWFFHQGSPVEIILLSNEGVQTILLGNDFLNYQTPQAIIPANTWFAARVKNEKGFALVSCTVAPGFDFRDFELAEREILSAEFPEQSELINNFNSE